LNNHKNQTAKGFGLVSSNIWVWRVDFLQQRTKVHRCLWNVVL